MSNGKPMKVRDLIHALQQFDPDSEAVTYNEALKTYRPLNCVSDVWVSGDLVPVPWEGIVDGMRLAVTVDSWRVEHE